MTQPASETPLYRIREGNTADFAFIANAWMRSNAETPLARQLGANYRQQHARLIWDWLPISTVRVACDTDQEDAILGFAVFHLPGLQWHLHHVFVRPDFRRFGIARALLADLEGPRPVVYTHQVSDSTHYRGGLMGRIPAAWRFDPYLFLAGPHT